MKRITEKVKDIVEIRSHVGLSNFVDDPLRTLSGYHFTDATADLMSKWLNRSIRVAPGAGCALALAGFRGVGKSHFMAAFGSVLSHPEYRSRLTDPLVLSTAQTLSRRASPVAFVRRGLHRSLMEELKEAIAPIIGCEPVSLGDSLSEILVRASECSGDTPLILLIDTAFERSSRVSRDDGIVISEIAEIAKTIGIFVGIALDDDISGADGANSSISESFLIDYLDQEHLYKIVDSHIFLKQNRMQPVLHEVYEYYRSVVPGFRWSEERFSKLYPLHPAIMEIAPFVRLYMHEFALLTFASEAGSLILGRPANSLIAPDEVFDKVEKGLRRIDALKDAFAEFDRLNTEIVARTPVVKRLQAKLILKGLFLFSLNDEGATASEIGASMLIFDEAHPDTALRDVEAILASFANAGPNTIRVENEGRGGYRYSFKLDGKEDLKRALDAAAASVPTKTVNEIFKRIIDDRYSDSSFSSTADPTSVNTCECSLTWRGGVRKGRISWLDGTSSFDPTPRGPVDWMAVINMPDSGIAEMPSTTDAPIVTWRPANFTDDEIDTVRRYHVLSSVQAFREEFQDHVAAAMQAHALAVDKVFQRAFIDDGVLNIEGFEYNFTEDARAATSLSQIFAIMLESHFEGRFPLHPYFAETIRLKDISTLVTDLFGGARPKMDDVQHLAEVFGLPLGVVSHSESGLVPSDADALRGLPLVEQILEIVGNSGSTAVSLDSIFNRLGAAPYGLVREAAYLLLSALVSARLLEFETSSGDRISHRSLDLKLVWDDIVAVTLPSENVYTNERLVMWAALITEKGPFGGLTRNDDRTEILESLQGWLTAWKGRRIGERFDSVSDDALNTAIWRRAAMSTRAFRAAAESIASAIENTIQLEGCLTLIADVFSDSEIEYARHKGDLDMVEDFVAGASLRKEIASWLSQCEVTGVDEIDGLRAKLYTMLDGSFHIPTAASNVDLANEWERFKKVYSGHFIDRHDAVTLSPYLRERLVEVQKTDIWWEFDNLSVIDGFDPRYRLEARHILKKIQRLDCKLDPRKILERMPACGCAFTLEDEGRFDVLPEKLWQTVTQGLSSYRQQLSLRESDLRVAIDSVVAGEPDQGVIEAQKGLLAYLSGEKELRRLSDAEVWLVRRAFSAMKPIARQPAAENGRLRIMHDSDHGDIPDFAAAVDELDALLEAMPR